MAFSYLKSVTVDHTQCGATDSSSFPVTICLDGTVQAADADLKTVGNGGFVQSSSGYDIRPYSDSALTTALTYQLVYYDAATGKLEMHVLLSTLSHTADTVFYLAFGDATISTDGSSTSTWPSEYKAVWHLKDGTTLSVTESTSNALSSTNNGATAVAGQMDGGASFNGTTAEIDLVASFAPAAQRTRSLWTYRSGDGNSNFARLLEHTGDESFQNDTANSKYGFFVSGASASQAEWRIAQPSLNAWHKIDIVYANGSSANDPVIYVDGVSVSVTNFTRFTDPANGASQPLRLGNRADGLRAWQGSFDEVRIADTLRSADWITAEYNSQKASSTFLGWGARQTVGAPLVAWLPQGTTAGCAQDRIVASGMST